jgi:hypothetical protein
MMAIGACASQRALLDGSSELEGGVTLSRVRSSTGAMELGALTRCVSSEARCVAGVLVSKRSVGCDAGDDLIR